MSSDTGTTDDEIEFTWKIENFDLYPSVDGSVIRSPLIALGNPSHSALNLELLHLEKSCERALAYRIKFLNKCPVQGFECEVFVIGEADVKELIPSLSFIGLPLEEKLIPQGTLTLQCQIKFIDPVRFKAGITELSHKIGSLYNNKDFSDITLLSDDEEFFLHKFLLHKRAPKLFDELGLRHEIIENERVKVSNISTSTLQNLLQYIYSGTLDPVSEESLPETYEMLKKYQFKEFENEIISLKSPANFFTQIKVVCKSINMNIDGNKVLNEGNALTTCIHIDFARFLVSLRLTRKGRDIQIQTSIRCLTCKEDEIMMSCKATLGAEDFNAERIRFSKSNNLKEHQLEDWFVHGKITSENNLLLNLHFKISNAEYSTSVDGMTFMFPEVSSIIGKHLLKDDLMDLLNGLCDGKDIGDVAIDYGCGKLSSHKAILAAWSPVFSRMFNLDMLEKKNNQVTISDVDYFAVFLLLTFMYSGLFCPDLASKDLVLYVVADKYQLTLLFEICSSSLASQLSDDNVCDILMLADQHSDDNLFASVQHYIATRRTAILASKEWLSLVDENPRLVSKVLRDMPFLASSE